MTAGRVVIVGNGMAGARLAEEIRARDPRRRLSVTVFGAEPHRAYNRVLLSNVVAGTAGLDDLALGPPAPAGSDGQAGDDAVTVHLGRPVTGIDRARREVRTADGARTPYDLLVLATGSRAELPPIDGLRRGGRLLPGAAVFRTLDDCRRILAAAAAARRAVVVGGGLLGVEAARGLAARGLDVELLHARSRLMDRQLDDGAGRVLERTLAGLGVRVRLGARTAAVVGADRVRAVRLDDGSPLAADLLVLACGVRPEVRLARAAGLAVDRGVVVDDALRSVRDPRVHAIGECAQHAGQVYGLVAPAWEQARLVAELITGADPTARYRGSRSVTRLKAAGVELAAMGDTAAGDDDAEVLRFSDPARGTYKKLVLRDDRVVGAILLGDIDTVGLVTQLYDRASPAPTNRLDLLFTGRRAAAPVETPARMPARATVCHCNGVSKGQIQSGWLAGARSRAEVAAVTRATTGCGGCRDTVDGILAWLAAAEPDPAPPAVPLGVPA